MTDIVIRSYRQEDEPAVEEITYRTGFNGEDLAGRRYFDDRQLFFLIFIYYYTRYEPEHCFVAVDACADRVVGFIAGTPDTAAQERRFEETMPRRIGLRAALFTIWRHPGTFKTLMRMRKMASGLEDREAAAGVQAQYPGHLHINLLPEYQRLGIGTRLMSRFEEHMASLRVSGLHLHTSNHNRKAIPFYKKMGYAIVGEVKVEHPVLDDFRLITFAKRLRA